MKNIRRSMVIFLALALLTLTAFSVMAAPQEDVIEACAEGDISGTVVAVDPDSNTVTIHTSGGVLCTVTINSYDHPIINLLGMYFGADDLDAESLIEALEKVIDNPTTCAVHDTLTDTWTWQKDCLVGETVTVLSTDEMGNVVARTSDGTIITFMTDAVFVDGISGEIAKVLAEWSVDETGGMVQVIDQIAAYHADGMGFGVLVKLYALADASENVTVEELVADFQSGMGMGQIFKEYGKPSKTGVGHVRHNKDKIGNGPPQEVSDDGDQLDQKNNVKKPKPDKQNKGICKPKPNNGKAKGRPDCSN